MLKNTLIAENNWYGRSPRPKHEEWGQPDEWTACLQTQTLGEDGEILDESERPMVHEPDDYIDARDARVLEILSDTEDRDTDGSWSRCQRLKLRTESASALSQAIKAGFAAGAVDEWDAPEMEAARTATLAAQWDFDGWGAILDQIEMRGYVILGGMAFA